MKNASNLVLILLISVTGGLLFGASGEGSTVMELTGSVGARSFIGLTQFLGEIPGEQTSISLDSGPVLQTASGVGVSVGDWSVSSNSSADLNLRVLYDTFTVEIEGNIVSIPYTLSNGTDFIASGEEFAQLVKSEGMYRSDQNNGLIYLKRTDSLVYPPSFSYSTVITFQLESN